MYKLLLLLLTLLPCAAFSQTIPAKPGPARLDGNTICLTLPVAAKVRDSLTVLPLVRQEARQWRRAAGQYKVAADSQRAAYVQQVQASLNLQTALRDQKIETVRWEVEAKKWKRKARAGKVLSLVQTLLGFGVGFGAGSIKP